MIIIVLQFGIGHITLLPKSNKMCFRFSFEIKQRHIFEFGPHLTSPRLTALLHYVKKMNSDPIFFFVTIVQNKARENSKTKTTPLSKREKTKQILAPLSLVCSSFVYFGYL